MDNEVLIRTLSVLGQETRLSIFRLLCDFGDEGACPSDIAEKLGVAAATLSFHLKTLTQAGLLDAEADGRFIRYRANHKPTRELVRYAAKHLCGLSPQPKAKPEGTTKAKQQPTNATEPKPAQQQLSFAQTAAQRSPAAATPIPSPNPNPSPATAPAPAPATTVSTAVPVASTPAPAPSRIRLRPVRILYLSPGNAARGILAEAITNHLGDGRFIAFSAGSQPLGRVNRYALKQLDLAGCPTQQARSKSWEEFAAPDAPEIDLLIGLWDAKNAPPYPAFRGRCQRAYWPTEDPSTVTASVNEAERAFANGYLSLSERIQALLKRLANQLDEATSAALA